jgi:hypothetical protein
MRAQILKDRSKEKLLYVNASGGNVSSTIAAYPFAQIQVGGLAHVSSVLCEGEDHSWYPYCTARS